MFVSTVWAQAAESTAQQPSVWGSMVPFLLMIAVLYFLILRPQAKKAKAHQELLAQLKRGDEVITAGGIYGKVEGLTDQFVTLEVSDGMKLKVLRRQVMNKLKEPQA